MKVHIEFQQTRSSQRCPLHKVRGGPGLRPVPSFSMRPKASPGSQRARFFAVGQGFVGRINPARPIAAALCGGGLGKSKGEKDQMTLNLRPNKFSVGMASVWKYGYKYERSLQP
ncbi:uncharacterized protein VTP21DRAFT_11034 [Calcarisporiella thermophila]|uniref:uncharacterized protein n=1 Tax=Calcarisporiella thermophila TaxID=911321 RepID=UPI003743EA6E